ncbi:MAG TPA: dihydrofolate reductase family protein [Mycobacteriales bacterium]
MRALINRDGPDPSTAAGLHDRYRPGDRRWVRAGMITSVDGSATAGGLSGGLGSAADQQVLSTLREHADVVLVGAGTVRAERYGAFRPGRERQQRRLADGRAQAPRLAVVGRATGWTGQEPWVTGAATPPLLVTAAAGAADVPGCETVVAGTSAVSLASTMTELAERGLLSVLCEGGPRLLGRLVGEDLLDELCVTFSPLLVGPGTARIVAGESWQHQHRMRLADLLEDDGLLFCRYVRVR